jgi:thiol-disulfide isomerase/thioredoxin
MSRPEGPDKPVQTSRFRTRALTFVPLALLLGLIVFAITKPAPDDRRTLPRFELPLLNGEGTLSNADLAGKPVVVNFWASWCKPCREETPLLQRESAAYGDDVVFLGVNTRDNPGDAKRFLERYDVTYPVVADADQAMSDAMGVFPLPQTFFVDSEGHLVSSSAGKGGAAAPSSSGLRVETGPGAILGAIDEEELDAQIDRLLKE